MKQMLEAFRRLWRGEDRRSRLVGYLAVLLLALVVRLWAAHDAYPVPGDGGHFVQHGIELANGNRSALSTYWSQGMILIAAGACKAGLSPHYALQFASLLSGVGLTAVSMLLAGALFGAWNRALLTGLFVAVNPAIVHYSIAGYSEMSYLFFMTVGVMLFWIGLSREHGAMVPLGFLALGISAYFKGADASVVAVVLTGYGFLRAGFKSSSRKAKKMMAGIALYAVTIFPLCLYTYHQSGIFAPGSKGGYALALGDYWSDSKAVYALNKPWQERQLYLQKNGTIRYLWKYRNAMCAFWSRNMVQAVRLFTEQLFTGPFRVGPAWLVLLLAVGSYVACCRGKWRRWILPAVLMIVPLTLICLCLVHDRVLIPSLFFLIVLLSDLVLTLIEEARAGGVLRMGLWLFLFLLLAKYGQLSLRASEREFFYWRYPHMAQMGETLRRYGNDSDVLMTHDPAIAVHFYQKHPMRMVGLPYGSLQVVEEEAARSGVTLLVISDQTRPHWPITDIFRGSNAPLNWVMLEERRFPVNEDKGIPAETYRVYRRP